MGSATERGQIDESLAGARLIVADQLLSLPHQLGLLSLVPSRQAMEQTEHVLSSPVIGHLMLVLAALLGEGTGTLVHPLVAEDLDSLGALAVERRGRQVGGCGGLVSEARIGCGTVAGQDD